MSVASPATRRVGSAPDAIASRAVAVPAALLCLAVAFIHVKDQGGLTTMRDPAYVGLGYFVLEIAAVVTAFLLLRRAVRSTWMLSLLVGAGPFLGYVLSRGPGLPGYTDDKGNWTEPLGLISLLVEGALVLYTFAVLRRDASTA